jgi:CRISPR-associated protein Cmr5
MAETKTPDKPTLDQRRAHHAYHAVQSALRQSGKNRDAARRFGGQARKLPTRIMASGLGQALAFLKAKNYAPYLLVALGDWVLEKRGKGAGLPKPPEAPDEKGAVKDDALLLAIITGTSDLLRRATDEALAYLLWLNRFAEAEGLTEGD